MAVEIIYFLPLIMAAVSPGLATWRRLIGRLLARGRDCLEGVTQPGALAMAGPRVGGAGRAAFRLSGAIGLVVMSLVAAQFYLSQSSVVAWIEQSTQQNLAVSLMRQPEFRHLH